MQKIIEKITNRINELSNYHFDFDEELDFLEKYFNNYGVNFKKIQNIDKLKNSDFFIASITVNLDKDFQETKEMVQQIELTLNNINNDDDDTFIHKIELLYFFGYHLFKLSPIKTFPFNDDNFIKFAIENDNIDLFYVFASLLLLKSYIKSLRKDPFIDFEKEVKEFLSKIIKTDFYDNFCDYAFNKIGDRINTLNKIKNSKNKEIKKLITNYKQIIRDLQSNKLIKYQSYFDDIEEDIQYELLPAIINHNEQFLNKKIDQLSSVEFIFNHHGFKFNLLSEEDQIKLKKAKSLNNIKDVLVLIGQEPFFFDESNPIFTELLIHSDVELLNKIKYLFNNDIIDTNFIYQHSNILFHKGYHSEIIKQGLFEQLIANIAILTSININIKNVKKYTPDLLLIDPQILKNKIQQLKVYGINFSNQENVNYNYILSDETIKIIDLFIELGLNDYIKNNIETVFSNSSDIIKRIFIAEKINFDIWNDQGKLNNSILTGYHFPIRTDYLNNYIVNATLKHIDYSLIPYLKDANYTILNIINTLDYYFQYEDNYLFENIIISRNKVIRNINGITANIPLDEDNIKGILLTSIISDSILSEDQITTIKNSINDLLQKKNKRLFLK